MGPPIIIEQLKQVDIELKIIPEEQTIDGIIEKIRCVASIIGSDLQAKNIIDTDLIQN